MVTYIKIPDLKGSFMKKYYKLLTILAAFLFITALSVIAQQGGDETAKDPICGMAVKIAGAKITAKDAEKIKMIQDKWAQKKAACDPALCPMKKKAEAEKKEAEKK